MLHLIKNISRSAAALRALIAISATVAVATACDEHDRLPASPSVVGVLAAHPAIVGATVTILPTIGGPYTNARDINDAGQVVGWSVAPSSVQHAFLWSQADGIKDLGTLGGGNSEATAVNAAGHVVGFSERASGPDHAFLWTKEYGMQDLGAPDGMGSVARDINDRGEIVGYGIRQIGEAIEYHALLWTPQHRIVELPTLGNRVTSALAINNAGQVVVDIVTGPGEERPFIWTQEHDLQALGGLAGQVTEGVAINERGEVGGVVIPQPDARPFIWQPDQGLRELGTLGGPSVGSLRDINDAGQVVGSMPTTGARHAFVWSLAAGTEDLYAMTGMTEAHAINNRGQVVGGNRVATLHFQGPNRAPVASVGGPYVGAEGSPVTLALAASDADNDAITYTWDLGDGTTGSGGTPPTTHVYADNGLYSVRLTVSDGKGGTDTKATTATIANVAPTIPTNGLTTPAVPIRVIAGSAVAPITLAFTDPAGNNDRYSPEIQCGNGVVLAPTNIASPYTGSCTYTTPGLYTVRAAVSDEDGGTSAAAFYRYVVVYDPGGGFVTGSGFYEVPGQSKGKAHFTFSVKFLPGQATAPNGTVKLWVPGGQVNVESANFEMLVVSGSRAQFWGTGTLNGSAARFRVTAVDGQAVGAKGTADAIRIELWNVAGTTLLYDTQPGAAQDAPITTPIEGGNIQIHRE